MEVHIGGNQPNNGSGFDRLMASFQKRSSTLFDIQTKPDSDLSTRQSIDCRPDLINALDEGAFQRSDNQPLASRGIDEALLLKKHQRLLNGLARHAELFGEFFLEYALTRAELAFTNRV